mgnify:FL=1
MSKIDFLTNEPQIFTGWGGTYTVTYSGRCPCGRRCYDYRDEEGRRSGLGPLDMHTASFVGEREDWLCCYGCSQDAGSYAKAEEHYTTAVK